MFFEMRFDLGTLDSGERSLPFGLLVFFLFFFFFCFFFCLLFVFSSVHTAEACTGPAMLCI